MRQLWLCAVVALLVPCPPDSAPSRALGQSADTGIRGNGRELHEAVTGLAWPVSGQQRREVSGDYIEGRSNHVYGCYCEWSGEGVTGGREAILAWAVREGSFEGVSLAGVKMAAVIVGEGTLSMGQAPRTSILFLDSAASAAQRQAAERLLRQRYARLLGEVRNVYAVPIQFRREADSATLGVGEMLNLTMRRAVLPDDVLQGATLWYDPFIPLEESTLGTTLQNRYWGGDFDQRWAHSEPTTSGYFGRFRLALD